jgi:cob(I)alamin adenosyltransferase
MGKIYLYTGNGAGKTTNALGLALRALGHGQKVLVVQLLKWKRDTGEALFMHPNYCISQWGRKGWHGFNNLTDEDKYNCERALNMLNWLATNIQNDNATFHPKLVILDEINLASHLGLINEDFLFEIVSKFPQDTNWVFTGRHATEKLINRADFVNEIVERKAPKEMVCEEGIQY